MLSGKFGVNTVKCKDQISLREMLLIQSPTSFCQNVDLKVANKTKCSHYYISANSNPNPVMEDGESGVSEYL